MIFGQFGYTAGTAGTATIPLGATIIAVRAQSQAAGATMTMLGGDATPIVGVAAIEPACLDLRFNPGEVMSKTGANTIVFATTVSFFVAWLLAPGQG